MTKTLMTIVGLAGLLTFPMAAHAGSAWHPGNGDVVAFTPEHVNAGRSRDAVRTEVAEAQRNGTLRRYQSGIPVPAKSSIQPKTRAQVVEEMRNQSPEALKAQKELFGG